MIATSGINVANNYKAYAGTVAALQVCNKDFGVTNMVVTLFEAFLPTKGVGRAHRASL